ncbi:MAG TPA: peptidylprolyl isomerase [Nitrospirae bacterium]|nr:peptidylprolyl isomerase [Nitrospirota bacterium]
MAKAKEGDTVRVHYSGFLEDGTVFDSSLERDPLEFTIGSGMLIPGFEDAVLGMDVGETKTVQISSDDAYGPRREELVITISREQIPPDIDPVTGQELQVRTPNGMVTNVLVTDVTEDTVTLDANHPLAGKDLIFEIKLVEIV